MDEHSPQQNAAFLVTSSFNGTLDVYPLLLTEDELIEVLRIPEISRASNYHNVVENLRRMHNLPCIHICKTPLFPTEAVRQWIRDKAEIEQQKFCTPNPRPSALS